MALATRWLERRRLSMVAPFLVPPVLDIGCGRCVAFDAVPHGYIGIDLRKQSLLERTRADIQTLQGSALELPFRPQTFQTVLLMAVVEHLPDPQACLKEATRVLKPGGRVVITTPTPNGDRLHHVLAQFGVTSIHAADEHQSLFSGAALRQAVKDVGLETELHRFFLLGGNQVCVGFLPPENIRQRAA